MDHKVLAWLVSGFLALMLILGVSFYFEDQAKTEQMEACVEAGKSWERDGLTSYYECK